MLPGTAKVRNLLCVCKCLPKFSVDPRFVNSRNSGRFRKQQILNLELAEHMQWSDILIIRIVRNSQTTINDNETGA